MVKVTLCGNVVYPDRELLFVFIFQFAFCALMIFIFLLNLCSVGLIYILMGFFPSEVVVYMFLMSKYS